MRGQVPERFKRDSDGSVRLRIRLDAKLATELERAANGKPLIAFVRHALQEALDRCAETSSSAVRDQPEQRRV